MPRRIALLAVVGCVLLAGCGGAGNSTPTELTDESERELAIDAPAITPGETGTLTIDVTNASTLRVEPIASDSVSIDYGNASHSPPPETTWTTYPPSWSWNGTTVTTTLPVVANADADRGTYDITIHARIDGEQRNRTVAVTVE
ncbi:hypothetical protein BV210_06950 [Halorientalis sp. IM1011]|uniref:hypothetical protein n=1 Tax=Halorientalis sp. IM1011 TaxID=1932360 RepID=UPI00097CD623|nr:hypothetical protein [Halorientalis sp. IM1011]AQL42466.1 hypothetical protein BV210_06950 [Halorientalis sp. IM1011]